MSWRVKFVPQAAKEFKELPLDLRKKFEQLFLEIEHGGITSLSKKRYKHITDGLWELRVSGKDNIARSIYVTESSEMVKILLVFVKKTQKTPQEFIELAQKRRSE